MTQCYLRYNSNRFNYFVDFIVATKMDLLLGWGHETLFIDVGTNEGRLIVVVTHNFRRVGEQ